MLKIAKNLELPDEAVTQTFAILAKRGVGKTYTASVMIEEMLKNNLHVAVVDPIGVWWGLRASANGKKAGLPIIVLGGEHGDIPLEPTSGELIANLVTGKGISVVIDLSLMRKGEQKRFMIDFAETLYHDQREPLHLVLDEADEFAPQRPMGDDARMLGAIEDLVRRGRARGIGVTLITQRPAVLNKNVLTQIEVLIAMRLTSPQDRQALNEWVKYHADTDSAADMITSLPTLPIGTAWIWSPGWLDIFKKIAVRRRETLDSSSTPKVGEKKVVAKELAEVDLEELKKQMSATIEKSEANDPRILQRKIFDLEKQLKSQKPQVEVREVIKEVAILTPKDIGVLQDLALKLTLAYNDLMAKLHGANVSDETTLEPAPVAKIAAAENNLPESWKPKKPITNEFGRLGPGEAKILTAAGQHPNGITRAHVTILTGYKRSSRNTYISRLAQRGLIETNGDLITITDAGVAELGNNFDPLPTGEALQQRLLNELPTGEKSILQVLIDAYPNGVSRDAISEQTGYMRSSRNTYLSRMSAREIIEVAGQEVRANDKLFVGNGAI